GRFGMTCRSFTRLSALLIALAVALAAIFPTAHSAEENRKVTVVSFGLFGGQGVFRSEANGAAEVVTARFGAGPVVVRFNTKRGGNATIETLAETLQTQARRMNRDDDILFVILTSHGSPDGLAINAGKLAENLTPSDVDDMREQSVYTDTVDGMWCT